MRIYIYIYVHVHVYVHAMCMRMYTYRAYGQHDYRHTTLEGGEGTPAEGDTTETSEER